MKTKNRKPIAFTVDDEGCFICTSHHISNNGYPRIYERGKSKQISRFVYEQAFGAIPEGHVIRHKCDKRSCINPEHLETGTQIQNIQDMTDRERQAKGEANSNSSLTEEEVKKIFLLCEEGVLYKTIAKEFKTTYINVSDIHRGKRWKYLKLERKTGNGGKVKGKDHHSAVLNDEKVRELYELRQAGASYKELQEMFSISSATVSHILKGRTWKHLNLFTKN